MKMRDSIATASLQKVAVSERPKGPKRLVANYLIFFSTFCLNFGEQKCGKMSKKSQSSLFDNCHHLILLVT